MRAAHKKKSSSGWELDQTTMALKKAHPFHSFGEMEPKNTRQDSLNTQRVYQSAPDQIDWKKLFLQETISTKSSCENVPNLVSRNVVVTNKRTSIRLEQSMWDALEEICGRENKTMNQICTHIAKTMLCSSFTAAVRVYTLSYYRAAATEIGHASVGHGTIQS